jgi:aconitate hydratase 2/2-methylisocitrate dehydratase
LGVSDAPPTKMDAVELTKEGQCGAFRAAEARTEMRGCACHEQAGAGARGRDGDLNQNSQTDWARTPSIPCLLGAGGDRVAPPTVAEYHADMCVIDTDGAKIDR